MRTQIAVVVAVVAVALTHVPPATAQDCGGDNPRWLLVTSLGARMVLAGGDEPTRRFDFEPTPTLIKVCDIADVGVNGRGETVIGRHSFQPNDRVLMSNMIVRETPAAICAALPSCSDATQFGTRRRD